MQEIAISKFKATCLSVLEEVRRSGTPVLITRFGHPVAEIIPANKRDERRWIGRLAGSGRITGDIVSPASDPGNWEALR